jgi:DNA repair exonuclease SbcCD ATPase subunit
MNLNQQFDSIKNLYHKKIGQLESLRDRHTLTNNRVLELTVKEDQTAKASLFLQSLSESSRIQILEKISGIVTDALQTVKDKNLVFQMNLCVKANQPTLDMTILDKLSGQSYDVINSFGGGISDIISIALRIALLCRWQPSLSRIILFDEVGKFVSVKDQELLAEFVKRASEALNLQMIWISHSNVLEQAAHKTFEVTKEQGVSHVTEKQTSL